MVDFEQINAGWVPYTEEKMPYKNVFEYFLLNLKNRLENQI